MEKIKQGAVALALLMFSGMVSANVPAIPLYMNYDIGILAEQYFNETYSVDTYLEHDYTFDLLSASNVNVTLVNLTRESGHIFDPGPVFGKFYALSIYDSNDNKLYTGTVTEKFLWGSTLQAKVGGVLPAGEDYYLKVSGAAFPSDEIPALGYEVVIQATPVPEPQTWAMLAAGLGVMGLAARRRKQAHFH